MAILVRNEGTSPFYFTATSKREQGAKFIAPGDVRVLSDLEWQEVPINLRGGGNLNPLDPSLDGAAEVKSELDYFDSGFTSTELRYLGESFQAAATSDDVWTIKRFDYVEIASGDIRISEIQVLIDVAWDDRGTLPWT